jgi:hypothetical protein
VRGALLIPAEARAFLPETTAAARIAIPLGLYAAMLLSLSYAARRNIPFLPASLILWSAGLSLTLGLFLGVDRLSALVPPAGTVPGRQAPTLGNPGIILSNGGTVAILLEDPGKAGGRRALSRRGRTLIYQASPGEQGDLSLPGSPFPREESAFFSKLFLDGSRYADRLSLLFRKGLIPFLLYTGSLIFLLVSLRFVLELGDWPLANLLIGALIFREVLAIEGFINLQDVRLLIYSFLGNRFPEFLLSPLIFCGMGILFIVYTLLVFLVRDRKAVSEGGS